MYGNITTYDRDGKGNIIKIIYPDGSTEKFTYDSLNNKTSYTDRNNAVTWYIYDGVSAYSETANQNDYAITTLTYYQNAQTVKNGSVKTITAPMGNAANYIEYQYNDIGEVSKLTKFINNTPYVTTYVYDNVHRVTKETAPDGTVTDYVYNKAGQVTKTTITNGNSVKITQNVYDNLGRKVKEISPVNGETEYVYNSAGFVEKQTDPLGNSTYFEYDFYGNITKQTLANQSYSVFAYDALNRKTSDKFFDFTTKALNTLETISYSSVDKCAVVTSAVNIDSDLIATTVDKYNFEEKLLEKTDSNGAKHVYNYTNGRLISEIHGDLSTINCTYDAWGNITKQLSSFDSAGQAETLNSYDKIGNLTSQSVKNNLVGEANSYAKTDFEYDEWGRKIATVYFDNSQENSRVTLVYDYVDRVIEEQKGVDSVVKFEYDHLNNIVKKTDALGQIETFEYDVAGRLTSSTDRNGANHATSYNLMNNPVAKTSVLGSETIQKSYTYDVMGNLISVDDSIETINYTYDGRGNRLTETRGNTVITLTYNNIGAVKTSEIKINGATKQTLSYTYNNMGKVEKIFENDVLISAYTYDQLDRKITSQKSNGVTETTTYNLAGLVTSVKNTRGNSTISEYNYTYYYDGNQRTKTEPAGVTTYTYDGLNRLKTAVLHDGTVQNYEFDKNGNRTKLTTLKDNQTEISTYTYDKNDRLTSETKGGNTTNYTYDNNGNMLSKSGGVVQIFDLLNRMTSFSDGVTNAVYAYNPDNMRRSKTVDNVKTEHIWLNSEISLDISGQSVVKYVSGVKSDYGWYIFNAHGDVVQLVDDNGNVVKFYDYDPYGNQRQQKDQLDKNPYRFSGEYYDFESGYVYLRARYYDTSLGRFISEDAAFDGHNWYVYCANNPVMYRDPTGQFIMLLLAAPLAVQAVVGLVAVTTTLLVYDMTHEQYLINGSKVLVDSVASGIQVHEASKSKSGSSYTDKTGKIAKETGKTKREVEGAIEKVKQGSSWRNGTKNRNPDVVVDTQTGEVYPKTGKGTIGDSIGNIYDYLD